MPTVNDPNRIRRNDDTRFCPIQLEHIFQWFSLQELFLALLDKWSHICIRLLFSILLWSVGYPFWFLRLRCSFIIITFNAEKVIILQERNSTKTSTNAHHQVGSEYDATRSIDWCTTNSTILPWSLLYSTGIIAQWFFCKNYALTWIIFSANSALIPFWLKSRFPKSPVYLLQEKARSSRSLRQDPIISP